MNNQLISNLIKDINKNINEDIKIMEVCGTHTHQIVKLGLKSLLSKRIKLISGPGCPVCVTDEDYIDTAIYILKNNPVTIATFGDLLRVQGSKESLFDMKSNGYPVKIIHSPLEMINLAEQNKEKTYVFLGVGFETTAPIIALTIKIAAKRAIKNLFFLISLKLMSPILHHILKNKMNQIDGFICPGHVASIKGSSYFKFISEIYQKPAVVSGFDALDIVSGVHMLVKEIKCHKHRFENYYKRCVTEDGNIEANLVIMDIFDCNDGIWRGIGKVENSSLVINKNYEFLDASKVFNLDLKTKYQKKSYCLCSEIILGIKEPYECKLFSNSCIPESPKGPCMVSTEGACAIAYKFMEV